MKCIDKSSKKHFYFLFMLLFFTSIFTLTGSPKEEAAAATTQKPEVSYSISGNKTVGSEITITVNVNNASSIYGGSLDFIFDSSLIDVTNAKMGTLFEKQIKSPIINNTKSGMTSVAVTLSGANKSLQNTSGSLVVITAKVKAAGTVNLKTTNNSFNLSLGGCTSCIKLSAEGGRKISYDYTDASITTLNNSPLYATITANKLSPQNINSSITLKANALGGTGSYQYKFFYVKNGTTTLLQPYSNNSTYIWTPKDPGIYTLVLETKDLNGTLYQSFLTYTINSPLYATITADKLSPQNINNSISLKANASGGTGSYQYKFFYVKNGTTTLLQPYSNNNTYIWTPKNPGTYTLVLETKDSNGTLCQSFLTYTINSPLYATITADKLSPQNINNSITLKANASGGTGSYQYKFFYVKNGTTTLLQPYSNNSTYIWTPKDPGTYTLVLETKDSNGTLYQSFLTYTINSPLYATITADKLSPQNINTSITLKANASGGTGSYQYKFFYVKNGTTTLLQPYSNNSTYIWTPKDPGTYTLVLETKDSNGTLCQSFLTYTINSPLYATITADKLSPQNINTSITLKANASGGTGSYQYKFFYVKNGTTTLLQPYSNNSTYIWTPKDPGTYTLVLETKDSNDTLFQSFLTYTINSYI